MGQHSRSPTNIVLAEVLEGGYSPATIRCWRMEHWRVRLLV